ncbi:unnamed protein product [Caenorhabditis angaria]|uniref:Uncharacterized protein n=1 Tax=Caenorhabditis angaria TaxID=860376 RepID=A0A9P1I517_9PELO|nr:unnamed protein product [Caenorhabditis angaria]
MFIFIFLSNIYQANSIDIREMCQISNLELTGAEGIRWMKCRSYKNDLKLRGITVAFRHGERSPMKIPDNLEDCDVKSKADKGRFRRYKKLAFSKKFQNYFQIDASLSNFSRVPDERKCESGMLTVNGAIQHLKLGRLFNDRYSKHLQNPEIQVTTSKFSRTFQSVLAFLSEFLPKTYIHITASNYSFQCTDSFCDCGKNVRWREIFKEQRDKYFENYIKTNKDLDLINKLRGFKDPLKLIDNMLGRYICRGKQLPDGMSYEILNEMLNITNIRSQKLFESDGLTKKLFYLEAWPVLSYVRQIIQETRDGNEKSFIQIFSGHDILLSPILRVLGISFDDPPHYTSRIVFEIYQDLNSKQDLYIRILYNGENRSWDAKFCEDSIHGMCRATEFEKFMEEKEYFKNIGMNGFEDSCQI